MLSSHAKAEIENEKRVQGAFTNLTYIRVSDSNIGLDDDEQIHLFESKADTHYGAMDQPGVLQRSSSLPPNFFSELVDNSISVYGPVPQSPNPDEDAKDTSLHFHNECEVQTPAPYLPPIEPEIKPHLLPVEDLWATDPNAEAHPHKTDEG